MLYILGRSDSMIIKAGMNIYPAQIEKEVLKIDEIQDCLVYGTKNNITQQIELDVVLSSTIGKKEIQKKIGERLEKYLVPSRINIVSSILKTPTGKKIRKK